jgi:bifunctional NMN adenylyltransferase/nudix hydrolase
MLVYIGRFQPFHNGHLNQIRYGLEMNQKMIVVIGTVKTTALNNPFQFDDVSNMIINSLTNSEIQRVTIATIIDDSSNKVWQYNLNHIIRSIVNNKEEITLLGNEDDKSTTYLNNFPDWNVIYHYNKVGFHASDVRDVFFNAKYTVWQNHEMEIMKPDLGHLVDMVPKGTFDILLDIVYNDQDTYREMVKFYRSL